MQLQRSNRELWLSFIAIIFISIAYIFVVTWMNAIPVASEFFGHTIGILGFILMLMTEFLYSMRKRSRSARWGRMATWLDFHIFTGLVGPFMVLLHSSWKFNGLAGVVTLLTVIIVASGFIGRYIYTAVPRTADGVEIEAATIERQIQVMDAELQRWMAGQKDAANLSLAQSLATFPQANVGTIKAFVGRTFSEWSYRLQWLSRKGRLDARTRSQLEQLEKMLRRRRVLQSQIQSLAFARRLLALWHAVHIPIGMALFTAAFIHILAAIYYATLLR
jgi:hypothetical protein